MCVMRCIVIPALYLLDFKMKIVFCPVGFSLVCADTAAGQRDQLGPGGRKPGPDPVWSP